MDIPLSLSNLISQEQVVLVLGAGASREAKNRLGQKAPDASELTNLIAEKFLGNPSHLGSLQYISELAISETNLFAVQKFIADIFIDLQPSKSHDLLPNFKWSAIATTNYDLLVERAYEKNNDKLQNIQPIIENGDQIESALKKQNCIRYIKLHGCVTRTNNADCPLILSTDQYIDYKKGRDRLFLQLHELGFEHTFVFIGHSLQDSDIRKVILDLEKQCPSRPRYYLVAPYFNDTENRFWESKRISTIKGTFEEFMVTLESMIPAPFRKLSTQNITTYPHSIFRHFCVQNPVLSENCKDFLLNDVTFLESGQATEVINPIDFYRGKNGGWTAIEQNLDVRRNFLDDILQDSFLLEDPQKKRPMEIILIKGYAGSGKTVAIQRLAWEAAIEYDCICLFFKRICSINIGAIQEIINNVKKRIFIFIDDVLVFENELFNFFKELGNESELITVILTARTNEWNMSKADLQSYVTDEYAVPDLSRNEITFLLKKLEDYHALGVLENKTLEERINSLRIHAGRQLLVALHEATLGIPFENILENEYNNLTSLEAKRVYISVCTMNRLNIPIRAGMISRLHKIPFSAFQERLFKPLEHVVYSSYDTSVRDNVYQARHPIIADIIFKKILKNEDEKFSEIFDCISSLNLDYSSDKKLFNSLTRANNLLSIFSNRENVESIFEKANELSPNDPYILQQKTIYEIKHPYGDLDKASRYITKAIELRPNNKYFKHTKSQLMIKKAQNSRTSLESHKYLSIAKKLAIESKNTESKETYSEHTLAQIALTELKDILSSGNTNFQTPILQNLIKDVTIHIDKGLQSNPNDPYLLATKSELYKILNNMPSAIESMEAAVRNNTRLPHIFIELAEYYSNQGDFDKAKKTYETAINTNKHSKILNYKYALFLELQSSPYDQIEYYLRNSFESEDTNYAAQLRYIKCLFSMGNYIEAKKNIDILYNKKKNSPINGEIIHSMDGIFSGSIQSIKFSHIFIKEDKSNIIVFIPNKNIEENVRIKLSTGQTIYFKLGLNYRGLIGFDCSLNSISCIDKTEENFN